MSGLLFLLDVAVVLLIALWLWGAERSEGGWRVRLFDIQGHAEGEGQRSGRPTPRWRQAEAAEQAAAAEVARPDVRRPQRPQVQRRPGWRRGV